MEFQDFYAGKSFDAYAFMGAHPAEKGYVFRVYAPAAYKTALIGEFSDWKELPMKKIYDGQFFEVTVPEAEEMQMYKFRIYKDEKNYIDHADPYAFFSEKRPGTASVVFDPEYEFSDKEWMKLRTDRKDQPLNIYEVHAGSWRRKAQWDGKSDPAEGWLSYRELADQLIPYLKQHHYNALELMPLAEYPADESWGYQETGFYSATSRYGNPHGLQYLVEKCHAEGISVILDVVTVHFAVNDYALWNFDGTALYEYPHPAVGYSEWGSCNFMHSRGDVCSFLQSACAFWLDRYHFDGLRFDAVGNLIYWQGNQSRGINRDAVRFMQNMNRGLKQLYPTAVLIAEDSTPYKGTARPVSEGGLGFDYKWDLGWMNDTLNYMKLDPSDRGKEAGKLKFSMDYFFTGTYLLPLSHDEVVHGKGTIEEKMKGNFEDRILQAKLLYLYMYAHPGKKLNFMGNEMAVTREWDERRQLDWESLNDPVHADFRDYMDRLNEVYLNHPPLWEKDYEKQAFRWISEGSDKTALFAFLRNAREETVLAVLNFTDRRRAFRHALLKQAEYLMDTHAVHAEDEAVKEEVMMEPYQGILFRIEQ